MFRMEIATTTLDDALAAQQGGADSIEISYDLSAGGLTPSLELVQRTRAAVMLRVHVIVRPHARDFIYTPADIDTILADTTALAQTGIDGVVFGALTPDHHLDIDLIQQVKQTASGLPITVHRALDESSDPDSALARLRGLVPRILTSGPAQNTWEGREGLRRWVQIYGTDFQFVASGGLTMERLAEYVRFVGAPVYHLGGAARTNGAVDADRVRRLRSILDSVPDSLS